MSGCRNAGYAIADDDDMFLMTGNVLRFCLLEMKLSLIRYKPKFLGREEQGSLMN
jgi:hypothetical protein